MEQPSLPKRKCMATGKVVFASRMEAKLAMLRLKWNFKKQYNPLDDKRIKHKQGRPKQRRIYYCSYCGGFHLTKMDLPLPEIRSEPKEPPLLAFVGVITWFDGAKGEGTVMLIGRKALYVNQNLFPGPRVLPEPGDVVVGLHRDDAARGSDVIVYCRPAHAYKDWQQLFVLLGEDDLVRFAGTERRFDGLQVNGQGTQTFRLLELGALQLCHLHDDNKLLDLFIAYYNQKLQSKHFIRFASTIEKVMPLCRKEEDAKRFLSELFDHFDRNMKAELLFLLWQKRKLHLAGWPRGQQEWEISREVIEQNSSRIRKDDLARIWHFSYGPDYCASHVMAMLERVDHMNEAKLNRLLQLLGYLPAPQRKIWERSIKGRLDSIDTR